MSDTEDEFLDADFTSRKVESLIEQCRNFVPDSCRASLSNIRAKLADTMDDSSKIPQPQLSPPSRLRSKKTTLQVENSLRDLSNDAAKFQAKIDTVLEAVISMIDTVADSNDKLNKRLHIVEKKLIDMEKGSNNIKQPSTFAAAVSTDNNAKNSNDRLNKLEYQASEDDRRKRILHVSITDPSINNQAPNLTETMTTFFSEKMKMSNREIDTNFNVQKASRNNTVIVKFSDRRYKLFLYCAHKKLRSDEADEDLFLNDDLTSYNFSLLMKLKRLRKERKDNGKPVFESVYSIDGRVFIKMIKQDPNADSIHIKTPSAINDLISKLDNPINLSS